MDVIFTDLDGTLLDPENYSWTAAVPALECLRRSRVPWVLVTSKTRAEVELWRSRLQNEHPFIVENGGAAFAAPGHFRDLAGAASSAVDGYAVLELGARYADLVRDLHRASDAARCRVRSFAEMSVEDVAQLCGMPLAEAYLAKQRDYDEPFIITDPDRTGVLLAAISRLGRNCFRGGRLWHITGGNDKAAAVRAVAQLYVREHAEVRTIGVGDGWNDLPFLRVVDVPALILSAETAKLQVRLPRAIVSDYPGPAGWNSVILKLIGRTGSQT